MKQEFTYSLKRSKRARRISVTVHHTGDVIVTLPLRAPELVAHAFVKTKTSWIKQTQEKLKKRFENKIILHQSSSDFYKSKKQAFILIMSHIQHFNSHYKFKFGKIRIRNQRSRWGSCARNGNLSFNYSLIKLPEKLADYIVVHELCHLKEFNHSKNFWNLVAETIPDYKERRKKLKSEYIFT